MNMARTYAGRLMNDGATDQERLNQIFTTIVCRPPSTTEKAVCLTLLKQVTERYQSAPEAAAALTKSEDASPQFAAWIQLVNTIMASDASIFTLLIYP